MEDNHANKESFDSLLPSDYEELEVRRTFMRRHVAAPDVDAAWSQWKAANTPGRESSEGGSTGRAYKRQPALRRYAIGLMAAAAAIALFLVLRGISVGTHRQNEVFTASNEAQETTYTTDDGGKTVVRGSTVDFTPKTSVTVRHIQMVTLSTARGKTVRSVLPDGTMVWLNADSRIEFPQIFTGSRREVSVSGEAYFDVRKDSRHPFVVNTGYFTSTVLGTSFNLRARSPEDASLTLVSGKVELRDNGSGEAEVLSPGECAVWDSKNGIDISTVDTYPVTQWKDGYFYFNNEPLVQIMQELGRWYNVSVVFEHPQDMSRRIHFIAEHNEKLSDIISRLNDLGIVRIELDDGVATVKKTTF